MRGSGKTFIGDLAASSLSWTCIDADVYFEEKHQMGVRQFVHDHGWPAFRVAECKILEELFRENSTRHVISLGGGIVESPAARDLLIEHARTKGPVVHIMRPIDEVVRYLGIEGARPAYGEPITEVFKRRTPWFKECCSHEFVNNVDGISGDASSSLSRKGVRDEVARFFKHITGQQPNLAPNLAPGKRSYFLSLTYPDITPALTHIEELTSGVDALELRVDLMKEPKDFDRFGHHIPSLSYVAEQIATLRRATSLPIVYTVRTVSQGGAFPDSAIDKALELLRLALRLGIEYLDVEISLPEADIQELVSRKGYSQIIASWHDWSGKMKWNGATVKEKYAIADRYGDIVKIVGKANSIRDNFELFNFVERMNTQPGAKPFLAINMGGEGQMSRILNTTFTPVSHPLQPAKAAPGQLSFAQIQNALHLIGQLPARQFYLFGTPIAYSMSPSIHNTSFKLLGLPHVYELLETKEVGEEIKVAITAPDFGGASVTIPHKLDIIPLLDKLSPAAELIGAVNTIVPMTTGEDGAGRILYGDNTDWLGIRAAISSHIAIGDIHAALVIGGGGTARAAIYALESLKAQKIYIYNRTRKTAQELVDTFPDANVQILDRLGVWPSGTEPPNVIVSTVPAYVTTTTEELRHLHLPSSLFNYRKGPSVVVDMAYKPADTPLLTLARATASNWVTVPGLEALLEQGFCQFALWTERKCPRNYVSKHVWEKYLDSE